MFGFRNFEGNAGNWFGMSAADFLEATNNLSEEQVKRGRISIDQLLGRANELEKLGEISEQEADLVRRKLSGFLPKNKLVRARLTGLAVDEKGQERRGHKGKR